MAREHGWLDDYTWFSPSSSAKKWNYKACYEEAKKYISRADFSKGNQTAYNVAWKNGWLECYEWFEKKKKPDGYWDRETCYDEAQKYKAIGEFCANSHSAYAVASKNGWLDDYTWLSRTKKRNNYWTRETCYNEAKKYTSCRDFRNNSVAAYKVSQKNGWLDDYKWFETPENKWNRITCYSEAKRYKSMVEFRKGNQTAYRVACENGWIDDYDWLEQRFIWTREKCYEEARNYKSRGEFSVNAFGAYTSALKHGWLVDYSWFEKGQISDKPIYIVYCYKDEETNSIYVGLTNNLKRRHRQHCNGRIRHGEIRYDIVFRYFTSIGKEPPEPIVLENGLFADDAIFFEGYYVELFKESEMNVLNLVKTGSLGAFSKWPEDKCLDEAKKYKTKSEFMRGSKGAYEMARSNGWLNNYTWFEEMCKPSGYWTQERCYAEAKRYNTKKEFRLKSGGAYNVARKHGWVLDYTWLEEKSKPNGYWTQERCFEEAKKYKTRSEFKKGNDSAYSLAMKNDWLKDYTWIAPPKTHKTK